MTTTVVTPEATGRHVVAWHGLTTDEACKGLGVDPRQGLAPAEVERRRAEVGPNRLATRPSIASRDSHVTPPR